MTSLVTITGRTIYPARPDSKSIHLFDIAYGLSRVLRYSGQSKGHTDVLSHSIRVASRLPNRLRIYGLLHDATEAYIGELPRSIKKLCPDYIKHEKKLQSAIFKAFGLKSLNKKDKLLLAEADQKDALFEIAGGCFGFNPDTTTQINYFMDTVIAEHKICIKENYDKRKSSSKQRISNKARPRKSGYSPY